MFWRRIWGAGVMILGASTAAAAATLAGIGLAARLEWAGVRLPIATVTALAAAGLAGGSLLTVFGRWIYGEWRDRAPVMQIVSRIAQTAGVILAATMGGLFIMLLIAGVGPGERQTAVALAGGMSAGFLVMLLGWGLKPSRRSAKFFD